MILTLHLMLDIADCQDMSTEHYNMSWVFVDTIHRMVVFQQMYMQTYSALSLPI